MWTRGSADTELSDLGAWIIVMTTAPTLSSHPMGCAVSEAAELLLEALEVPLFGLSPSELRLLVRDVTRLSAAVATVEAAVLVQADRSQIGVGSGATSTANWVAHQTKHTRTEAHRRMRLARDLDQHDATSTALAQGRVLPEQAQVILDAVAEVGTIPEDLVAQRDIDRKELARSAEEWLLEEARQHDAKALRILGRRILDVIAPEVAEEHECRLLEQEEERARQKTRLTMSEDGHGAVHGRFTIPALHAAMLKKALLALAAPKHQAATSRSLPSSRRPSAQRLGAAFCEYVERYPADRTPAAGGAAATVVVTLSLEHLQQGLGAGVLDDGGRLSATQVRRLACEAGIIPAVLGGKSQPLDVGRKRRFHTEPQRIAMATRDGGCTAEGCDCPPGLCHAHHDTHWGKCGRTSVADGRLLCPTHHAMAHDPRYQSMRLGTGKLRFARRT